MRISVVIPAHNEEKIIQKTIKSVKNALSRQDYEIIAVDDNSNDNTGKILGDLSKSMGIKVLHIKNPLPRPSGLGKALNLGFGHCSGDVIVPFMGDLSDNPKDIIKLVKKIKEGYDVVCGSRFVKGGKIKGYPLTKLIINRLWNNLFAFLFGMKIKDISIAFKAYRKKVIVKIKPNSKGFEITAEIVLKAFIHGFKITEVPVSWRERSRGESKFISSPKSLLTKLPSIGYGYFSLGFKLWLKYLSQKLRRLFIL
jgi:glycosyltransferase involved in cell wall biosynthesis